MNALTLSVVSFCISGISSQDPSASGWSECPDDLADISEYLNSTLSWWLDDMTNRTYTIVSAECRDIDNTSYHAQIQIQTETPFSFMLAKYDYDSAATPNLTVTYFNFDSLGFYHQGSWDTTMTSTTTSMADDIRSLLYKNGVQLPQDHNAISVTSMTTRGTSYGVTAHVEITAGPYSGIVISFFYGSTTDSWGRDQLSSVVSDLTLLYTGSATTNPAPTYYPYVPVYYDDLEPIREDVEGMDLEIIEQLQDLGRNVKSDQSVAVVNAESQLIESGGVNFRVGINVGDNYVFYAVVEYYLKDAQRVPEQVRITSKGSIFNTTPAPYVFDSGPDWSWWQVALWISMFVCMVIMGTSFKCYKKRQQSSLEAPLSVQI